MTWFYWSERTVRWQGEGVEFAEKVQFWQDSPVWPDIRIGWQRSKSLQSGLAPPTSHSQQEKLLSNEAKSGHWTWCWVYWFPENILRSVSSVWRCLIISTRQPRLTSSPPFNLCPQEWEGASLVTGWKQRNHSEDHQIKTTDRGEYNAFSWSRIDLLFWGLWDSGTFCRILGLF